MKRKKKLLTYVLVLSMMVTLLVGINASKETLQAAERKEIYVTTIKVEKGIVECNYKEAWYDATTPGMFLVKYNFNKKCTPEFAIVKPLLKGRIDYPNAKNIKKGKRKTTIVEKGSWLTQLGVWDKTINKDVLSDKTVSGTVDVYFIPTCDTITLDTKALELTEGSAFTLSATPGPTEYAKNFGAAKWTSSKPKVAKVDKNGKITALSAGKTTITVQVDTKKVKCTVTVRKKQEGVTYRTASRIQLSKTTYNYTGKAKTPKVTVYDTEGKVIPKAAYEVTYVDNINAGTATVKVQVNQTTYKNDIIAGGFLTETFTIKPLKAKDAKLAKTSYDFKFKSSGIQPKVTVYDSNGKKISSKEYTVTYKNNKQAGTAKAIIQMNQNYGNKSFTREFTLKYNEKTNELLPKSKIIAKYHGKIKDVLYYTEQPDDMIKKVLPYGDVDVEFDELCNTMPFLNENVCFPNMKDGAQHRQSYADTAIAYLKDEGSEYSTIPFAGTLSDLIKCATHSKIVSVRESLGEYSIAYYLTCEDGSQMCIRYGSMAGMQYSKYSLFSIKNTKFTDFCYYAPIKVDKSKTPWGKK